jgi:hypothetical protein
MKYKNVLGKDFNKKSEAYKHFQKFRDEMIRTFQLGKYLTEETPVKKSWMDQLFKDYFLCQDPDYYKRKIGLGVQNWFFAYDSQGGICLWIKQKDKPNPHNQENCKSCREGEICFDRYDLKYEGEKVPVAAKWIFTCFGTGVHNNNPLHRVKDAMRKAIKYQTKEFRDSVRDECQECGEEGYGLDLEVDHTPNFTVIAKVFIEKYGEEYLIKNVSKAPTEDIWYFINDKLKNEWCEYHLKKATLRLLCTSCHDKKTYKKSTSGDITSPKT